MPTAQQGVPGSSAGSWQELCDSRDAPDIAWFSAPSGAEDARIGIGADTPNTLLMRLLQKVAPDQVKTMLQDISMKADFGCYTPNRCVMRHASHQGGWHADLLRYFCRWLAMF